MARVPYVEWGDQAQFEVAICNSCAIVFGLPAGFIIHRRSDKQKFYCPNGHDMFYAENEADQLRRERDLLKQRIAQKDDEIAAERRAKEEAQKKIATAEASAKRLHKRAQVGLCPCCNRTFSQLARHMKSKHPDQTGPHAIADLPTVMRAK